MTPEERLRLIIGKLLAMQSLSQKDLIDGLVGAAKGYADAIKEETL